MLRVSQLKLRPGHSSQELEGKLCKYLHISRDSLLGYQVVKQSIDARKKPDIFFSYTIDVKVRQESTVLRKLRKQVHKVNEVKYQLPECVRLPQKRRPVVTGSGPAGLFCAYLLAKSGLCPLLLERGGSAEERLLDVEEFWKNGKLDLSSNVQFGEGGAGTFSDGKLNTLVKDTHGRSRFVLETFVEHGAPDSILYEQKPHIGTDILIHVVKNMRKSIEGMGGEIRFHSQMTDIVLANGSLPNQMRIKEVIINQTEHLRTDTLILAIGHSARDTFAMLHQKQLSMQAKAFAVGVRIEHPQSMINECQYAQPHPKELPAASYKLTAQLSNGRGAYTFCMCPGGYVVNASSEENRLAVNGMSYHSRDGQNANSAVIVTVTPDDFGSPHPLAGVEFQRTLEERAYAIGNGKVPVQCFGDYCKNQATQQLGGITPQIRGAYTFSNLRPIFSEELAASIEEGIRAMDHKIHGFSREDAVLSGVESRTSSPVKMLRNEEYESNFQGIYPCGEGAGYAGGITSAAMDGMKVAEALVKKYSQKYLSGK